MAALSVTDCDWIRWCHSEQPDYAIEAAVETAHRMAAYSPYPSPLLRASVDALGGRCGGYGIACEGAIVYLGRFRCTGSGARLPEVVRELCAQAAHHEGIEIVQAIVPATPSDPKDDVLPQALEVGGMSFAARLIQMESLQVPLVHDGAPLALHFSPVEFRPYGEVPWSQWCDLVEATYRETLDVPIMNGLRSVENSLRGYAVGQTTEDLPWWAIHIDGRSIGCLMLSNLFDRDCELTYLGLVPEARGHRYSPEVMDFVSDWMVARGKDRMVLAVDECNVPALHLYRSFGFLEVQSIDAWFYAVRR